MEDGLLSCRPRLEGTVMKRKVLALQQLNPDKNQQHEFPQSAVSLLLCG
jgi:hypothetical protein